MGPFMMHGWVVAQLHACGAESELPRSTKKHPQITMEKTPGNATEKGLRAREATLSRRFSELCRTAEDLKCDPAIMKLAHPARVLAIPQCNPDIWRCLVVGVKSEPLLLKFFQENLSTTDIWLNLSNAKCMEFEFFIKGACESAQHDPDLNPNSGAAGPAFHAMRYQAMRGTLFTIESCKA